VTLAPAGSDGAHEGAVAVTVWPDWETVAFQPPVTWTPAGDVHVAVQFCTAAVPVLVSFTEAVNPPFQEFSTW
jgi:hypothetical protein